MTFSERLRLKLARIPPEKMSLFRRWDVARTTATLEKASDQEQTIQRICSTDIHSVVSRGALVRHLDWAVRAFLETIPLGHYGGQLFGLVVTGEPANLRTELDSLSLSQADYHDLAPAAYIWVEASSVEAMIKQPPDGFPQRTYGCCAGKPLEDEATNVIQSKDMSATPQAYEQFAESDFHDNRVVEKDER
jgi:hypothetical protein